MKKFFSALIAGLILFSFAIPVKAQTSRLYFAGYMGLTSPNQSDFTDSATPASGDVELDNTLNFAGALGLRINHNIRVEAEIAYQKANMDRMDISNTGSFKLGGDLEGWTYLLNGYYDFDLGYKNLIPFITAGVGIAVHDVEIDDISGFAADALDSDWGFAWQAGSGLKYRIKDNLAFTGSYRYLGSTEMGFDSYDIDFSSHEIRLGLEYDIPVNGF
jgi:opacity protein-like surface antigen